MRVMEIVGKVTLSKCHESLRGATWLVAVPMSRSALENPASGSGRGEPVVVYDELGANRGAWVAVAEGAEGSAAFHPDQKPVDAYNAAILDSIDIR